MLFQISFLTEALAAMAAFEGFDARVEANVVFDVA